MASNTQSNILILGLGESGLAAAELAIFRGCRATVLDANQNQQLEEQANRLEHRGATVCLDWNKDHWDDPVDLCVISPGVGASSVLGRLAAKLVCPVISELEFGFRHCSCPLLAITGTNGKTTTTELAVHCLKGAGRKVVGAGNLGLALSDAARKSATLDCIVAEVSSFQLERIDRFAPIAAALLNVTEDHLDRHGSMAEYLRTKLQLFRNLSRRDRVVIDLDLLDDATVQAGLPAGDGQPVTFSTRPEAPADYVVSENGDICFRENGQLTVLIGRGDLKLQGKHNAANICAALALCRQLGVDHAETVPLVKKFAPSAHRFELVASRSGTKYVNDSKATNPDALIQALRTCAANGLRPDGKVVLIAGGRNKGMSFKSVVPYLREHVRTVCLLGEARDQMAREWDGVVPCMKLSSLAACVDAAAEAARSGDIVLLSPGCASQDMFSNYADRGNQFSHEVKRRLGE